MYFKIICDNFLPICQNLETQLPCFCFIEHIKEQKSSISECIPVKLNIYVWTSATSAKNLTFVTARQKRDYVLYFIVFNYSIG